MKRALTLIFLLVTISIYAQEGTKQLMPNSNDRLWLEFNVFSGNNFGNYSATEKERIHIYLNAGEVLHFGMKMNTIGYSWTVITDPDDVEFRIKDPNGVVVFAEQNMVTSGNGYISTYTEAVTGPNGVVLNGTTISGGYNALTYTAATSGNHYIEFNENHAWRSRFAMEFFDVTVTDASNNVITNPGEPNISAGRLWSKGWLFTTTSYDLYPVKADFYVFTSDEFINKVSYEMKPYSFSFVANSYGVNSNTSLNYIERAQSQDDDQTTGDISEYRVYLNDPDRIVWPNTTLSPPKVQVWAEDTLIYDYDYYRDPMLDTIEDTFIELEKNRPACTFESITIFKIEASVDGFVAVLIDIDGGGYTTDGNDRVIYREMKKGLNYILWNFKDDNGVEVANADYIASATFLGRGPAHFPLYDVESLSALSTSSVRPFKKLELTNYWDDSQITTWGDALGAMDETDTIQLVINEDVPRVWTFDDGDAGGNHNGNMNTINSWFHAIDLGLSSMTLRVEQSATKCVDGTAPYVGDIYKYGDKNTTMNFEDTDFSDKFFDPTDQSLSTVQILSLPGNGILYLSGVPVSVNDIVTSANTNFLTFEPNSDWYGESKFAWQANNGTKWSNNQDTVHLIINTDPVISSIADQTICTNTSLTDMPFTVGDDETPDNLNIIAYSHNTSLVPNSNISIGGSGTNKTITVTPNSNTSGFAIIYVKVDDGLSEAIEEFSLYVGPDLEFSGDTTVCVGDDLNLIAQEVGATYDWKIDATTLGTSKTLNIPAASVQAGSYSLTVTKDGCSATRYFEVAVAPLTTFAGDVDVCVGEEISLSATETVAIYSWKKGAVEIATTKVLTISNAQLSDDGNDYTLEVTKEGCNNTSDPFTITVINEPDRTLTVTGNTVNQGNDGTVTITLAENGIVYDAYIGGTFITTGTGTGANLDLTIPFADLNIGDNTIDITANNGNCEVPLDNAATVHVNVLPVANDDTETVAEDASVNTDILNNDSGLEDGGITVTITANPANGTAIVELDNTVTYTPNEDYNGANSYTYQIQDADGDTDDAVVNITVSPVNDVVDAIDDAFSVNEDGTLNENVITNDLNLGDGGITTSLVSNVSNGTLILNADGSFTYTPNPDYHSTDNFTYRLRDANGDTDDAIVTITVNSVNDIVDAVDDAFSVNEDIILNENVLTNDLNLGDGGLTTIVVSDVSNGTLTLNIDGTFTYTPDADYNGSDSFEYQLEDTDGDTDNATVTITVNSVNDIPVANDDAESTNQDTDVIVSVLSNDTGLGDGVKSLTVTSGPANGSTTVNVDNTITYSPDAGFSGTNTFTYEVCDNDDECATATVTITVDNQDDFPIANDDVASVDEDSNVNIDVLVNDQDLFDGGLVVTVTSDPSNGTAVVELDNTITYTPDADYNGPDVLTYQVCDGDNDCDNATVTITVNSVNDVVNAIDDAFSVNEDGTLNENVLTNDLNLGDGGISVSELTGVSNGTLSLNADGSFTYTPDADYNGSDSFTYELSDGDGDTDNATVTITVNTVNDVVDAINDAFSVNEDGTLNENVLTNDLNLGDGGIETIVVSGVSHGTLTLNLDGTFTYTPDANYYGSDSFTYELSDGDGDTDNATVTITVSSVNDVVDAIDDAFTVNEDGTLNENVITNDLNLGDGGIATSIVSNVSNGTLSLNADGTFTYSPNADYHGSDSFTYQLRDTDNDTDNATVTITINSVNDTPVATDDSYSVNEDATLNDNVSTNDLNLGDGGIVVSELTGVSHGTLNLNADGSFDYTPDADYNGADGFTYQICDGDPDCDNGTVSINVFPVNDIVIAVDDNYTVNEDETLNDDVLTNDQNLGDGGLVVSLVTDVTNGSLTLNADGTFSYTGNAEFNGSDSFTYQLQDGNGDTDDATVDITIDPVNDIVDAIDDTYSVDEDNVLNGNVQDNDQNLGDGNITISLITDVTNGTLVLNSDGAFTYNPNTDYNGTDSFIYEIEDDDGDTDQATASITVNSVNDTPVAVDDNTGTQQNTAIEITVLANDQNLGDGVNSVTITTPPTGAMGAAVVNPTNTITFTPTTGYTGTATFQYQVCDNDLECSIATVTVVVDNVDDQPIAVDDTDVTDEDVPTTIDVLANDGGLFDGGIIVTIVTNPTNGTTIVNVDNTITYTSNTDWYGTDVLTYQVCDVDGDCDMADVSITVNPINDYAPVANDDSCATSINTPVTVDVLINDTDLEDGELDVTIETPPASGSTNIVDNKIIFTPAADFTGTITLDYRVCDRDTDCDVATVKIEVKDSNVVPTAIDDNISTIENTSVDINVLANDTGLDEGIGAVTLSTAPENGTCIVNADYTLNYTPDIDFVGSDSLEYKVEDVDGDFDIAKVYITVNPKPNYIPVANDDSRGTSINTPVDIDVLVNDTGLEDGGIVVTINLAPNPLEGSVTVNGDMTITFTPAVDYIGTSTFDYEVCDKDTECDIATVTINVKESNNLPVANDDATTTYQNESVDIHVLDNDNGLNDGIQDLRIYTNPSNGSVGVNPDNTVTYTPSNWYLGTDQFEYLVEDIDGDYDIATVTVSIIVKPNFVPVAVGDNRGTTVNTPVNVDVLLNDSGLDDGGIVVSIKTSPNVSEGSAAVNLVDNTIDFTPATDFIGDATFEYLVCDINGDCDSAFVVIHVKEENNIPSATNDSISTWMNTSLNFNVIDNDSGLDDGIDEVTIYTDPVHGTVTVYGDNTLYYTPSNWFTGEDSLKYMVEDIDGDYSIATVYIEIKPLENNLPVANNDSRGTSKNTDVIVDVLFNDTGLEDGGLNLIIDSNPTNGSVVINVDNTITYIPNADYTGSDIFEYHVCDIDGDCSGSATVTINVKEVNIVPVAVDDEASTFMDTPVTINVLANDTKLFDGIQSLNIYSDPANGVVVVNPDRTITYTPDNWYLGTDQFEYWVEDVDGDYSIATVTVTIIEEPNYIPVANDDARGTEINTDVIVDVLINDTGLEDGGIVVTSITNPTNGSITVNADNTITYTPNNNYSGTDNFDYQVCDADGDCSSATVTITVKENNSVPVAVDDNVNIYMNISETIHVLSNDTGLEDGIQSLSIYSNPTNGNAIVNTDNTITYTPSTWYVGSDSFEYMVEDIDGDYSIATVTLTITEEPDYLPVANNDSRATEINTAVNIDVLINDSGLEDGGLGLSINSIPANGTAVIEIDNTITYTPNADYLGTDEFTYQVCDIDGDCSTAIVTINVKETNNQPVANDDNVTTIINTSVVVDVLNNDTGLEDGVQSVIIQTDPNHGLAVVNADNTVTYTPNSWYTGPDNFEYMVSDIDGDYSIATVNISVTSVPNYIPVANDDARGTEINTDVIVDILVNDTGLEDGGLVLSIPTNPSNGSVVINGDNTITYSPNSDYLGTDNFEYQVCDTDGDCSTATVTITVKETNNLPVAVDDAAITIMNTVVDINVLSNDTGLEDGILEVTEYTSPSHGNIIINAGNTVTYTPNNWYVGSDSFEYMVSDVDGDYSIARVAITVNPKPNYVPIANDDARGTSVNTDVVVDVLFNDTGLEDGGLVLTIPTNPLNGSVVINGDNTITYSPNTDYSGTDNFEYQVCDADGDCSTATVTITVKETNNIPVANDDDVSTYMNTEVSFDVLDNDTGLEDGVQSVTIATKSYFGSIVINADNTISYTPPNWFIGTESFDYIVTDVDGDYATATVTIIVDQKPNYMPVANDDARGTSINTDVIVDILTNDTGLEDGGLVLTIVTNPTNGTFNINTDNTITYTPNNNYLGADNFEYQVCDVDDDCATATVTITVREENTVPVAVNDKVFTGVDTDVTIDVLGNDSGLDDGGISVTIDSDVSNGSVIVNGDNTVTYSPDVSFEGTDNFTYRLIDVDGDYDIADVEVIVMSGTLPGITISSVSGDTEEDGTEAIFTVVLKTQPTQDVNIDLNSDNLLEGIVSDTRLTFTSSNWDTEQTVTITGQDDDVDDGDIDYNILIDNAVSTDPIYNGITINNISLRNIDDDEAGITVILDSTETSEDRTEISFNLVLNSQPLDNVSIGLESDNIVEGTIEVLNVEFNPINWSDTITVIVIGQDDDEVDGDINYNIIISAATSTDSNYDGIDPDDIALVNIDNDSRELIVPEAFSPGNDGFNDYFEIVNLHHYDKASLRVYNRWGSLVYSNDNYQNDWEGKGNVGSSVGSELPTGTYYFILEIKDTGAKKNGSVFIKR